MAPVLNAKRITTGQWVDVASLCGTSSLIGTSGGPTNLDGFWSGVSLERDAVSVAGEDRARPTEDVRGVAHEFPLELLIVSDTPAGASAVRDALRRLFPAGQVATLKLGDADRVLYAIPDRLWAVRHQRIQTDDWAHGDQLVTIPFTVFDGALYDETPAVDTLVANTAKKVLVGNLPSFFLYEAAGFSGSLTLQVFRDDGTGTGPAATPYASIVITGGTSGALTIDTRDGVDDAYVGAVHQWDKITSGWFPRLGEGIGEEHVWVKSSIGATLTHARRW